MESVEWIDPAHNKAKQQVVVDTVLNLLVK
jgi:hypothetical protein